MDTGLTPIQVMTGAGKDWGYNLKFRGLRYVSGKPNMTTVILPADQQYKMPPEYQSWSATGEVFNLKSHVLNREAFMFLMNMCVKELPDCCWFNWSDVMFLEADSLDQHIGILPQLNYDSEDWTPAIRSGITRQAVRQPEESPEFSRDIRRDRRYSDSLQSAGDPSEPASRSNDAEGGHQVPAGTFVFADGRSPHSSDHTAYSCRWIL